MDREDDNMIDPAMALVVGANDRTFGAGSAADIQFFISQAEQAYIADGNGALFSGTTFLDYTDAIGYLAQATSAAVAAENQLVDTPSAYEIGQADGVASKAYADAQSNYQLYGGPSHYATAYQAATDALNAYAADLGAQPTSATQQPASAPSDKGYYVAAAGVAVLSGLFGLAIWKWS